MGVAKRVAINTGILYARMAITVFISLYVTRLILAALGADNFGIFNLVGGAIAMLTFLNLAMARATQRFMSYAQGEENNKKQKQIFNVAMVLHFAIAITLVFVLEFVGYFLFDGILKIPDERINAAKLIFQFMLVSTFFTVISVPYDAVINAHENMLLVAVLGIFEAVAKLFIAIYITYSSFDKLVVYGLLMAMLSVILLILRSIYCHLKYEEVRINIKKYYNRTLFKEMSSFAGWALLSSGASVITMQGISIVFNVFFGVIVNAAQGIAAQVSGQLMAFSNMMLKALNPVIVKTEGGNNRNGMLEASMAGNKLSFYLLAFFAVPVILEMPFILGVWLRDVPEYTIVFCRLRLVAMYIAQLTVTFPTAIGAIGKIKQMSFINSIIWISLLPISYIMFTFGAPAYALYMLFILMQIALSSSLIYFLFILGGLPLKVFFYNVIFRCVSSSFLTVLLTIIPLFFLEQGLVRLTIVLIINSIACFIFIYVIGLNRKEKQLILSGVKELKRKIRN